MKRSFSLIELEILSLFQTQHIIGLDQLLKIANTEYKRRLYLIK